MSNNDLTGKASFAFFVELYYIRRAVLFPELIDHLSNSQGELSIEDTRPELAVVIDVVFAEARIIAMDHVVVVFIDQHHGRAEDHEVEIDRSN